MEIRPLRETDDRLAVSRIYEESWRFTYRDIVPQAYLNGIPAGLWAASRWESCCTSATSNKYERAPGLPVICSPYERQ